MKLKEKLIIQKMADGDYCATTFIFTFGAPFLNCCVVDYNVEYMYNNGLCSLC